MAMVYIWCWLSSQVMVQEDSILGTVAQTFLSFMIYADLCDFTDQVGAHYSVRAHAYAQQGKAFGHVCMCNMQSAKKHVLYSASHKPSPKPVYSLLLKIYVTKDAHTKATGPTNVNWRCCAGLINT